MNLKTLRTVYSFTFPGGLLLASAVLLVRFPVLPPRAAELVPWAPYAIFALGALLSWRFNRTRVLYTMIVLALAYRVMEHYRPDTTGPVGKAGIIFDALTLLLPMNVMAFSLVRERGTATRSGIIRLALILLQLIAVVVICRPEWASKAALLHYPIVRWRILNLTRFSQPALIAFVLAFVVLALRFFWIRKPLEGGFFWTLITAFLALNAAMAGRVPGLYFTAAGLILVISLIEMSHSLAFRDELTGLPGRRAFNEAALKLSDNYTVAMVDVDHFKKFNDTYGHKCGDQVLRMVATKLAEVQGGGQPFRYGGEEFSIIFPGKQTPHTIIHLEHLRQSIADTEFRVRAADRRKRKALKKAKNGNPRRTHVTVSIGVADHTRNGSFESVVKLADMALYRAKEAGRDRVEC